MSIALIGSIKSWIFGWPLLAFSWVEVISSPRKKIDWCGRWVGRLKNTHESVQFQCPCFPGGHQRPSRLDQQLRMVVEWSLWSLCVCVKLSNIIREVNFKISNLYPVEF